MKKVSFLFFYLITVIYAVSQTPAIISTKYINNWPAQEEMFYDSKIAPDGGYIVVGTDTGWNFNKTEALTKNFGGRPWIARLDDGGNKKWSSLLEKNGLYSNESAFTSVCREPGGLYVAAGFVRRPTSNVVVAAYNASGLLVWDTAYGGSGVDRANSVQSTPDGGYIVAGYTTSNDGPVSGNHSPGIADVWLIKLDANRQIQWQKCYGGTGADTAYAVLPTEDNGFIIVGTSASVNGDLTGNNGLSDGWVFKTNSLGNIIWQKNIGGASHEGFRSVVNNSDGLYTLTGYTTSASVLSNGIKGRTDVWVITIDGGNGNTIWSKGFGGAMNDQGLSISKTLGNGFLVAGFTESANGDVTTNYGVADAWLLSLDNNGSLIWQKTVGTNKTEYATAAHYVTANNYVVTGVAGRPDPAADSTDGYFAQLGNASHLKGSLVSSRLINEGIVKAIKQGKEYSTLPVNGVFRMDIDTGTYTVSYDTQNPNYTSSLPVVVNITAYHDTTTVNFNVTATPGRRDLTISVVSLTPARPGFQVTYKIVYKNLGTDTVTSGQIVVIGDSRINFVASHPAANSKTGDTIKWNYSNLKPFDSASIILHGGVKAPPEVNINDILTTVAIITPPGNSTSTVDDTVIVRQTVQGAADPNDKTENLGGNILPQQVAAGHYLNYIIRFQNTGNDTAFNVFVRDTLDTKLDWSSLQMVSASHPFRITVANQNRIEWSFDNIKLPDSSKNEPLSHGYIVYRVKPKTNLMLGNIISNSASIYFDFNLPVRTNIQQTIITNPQPSIISFTPTSGGTGDSVTITGTNFTGAMAVSFGGTAATSFTVNSPTSIIATVGIGASGNVSVTTPGGTTTLAGFTFIAAPTITSFTPTSAASGATVTITGTNLTGATAVSFGGTAASSFTVNSSTSITATLGSGVSGSVSVTTPGGTATLAGFIFIAAPTITSFTPTSAASGATVTITGTNFTGATAVSFGGVAATSFTVNSPTSITATIGAGASGNVSITTPGGTATLAGFTFIAAPTITSFTPTSGGTGASITITGTNFTGATAVSFGGTAASSFAVNSATSITATIGTGASGDVSVTTPGGTAILSGFTFISAPTITSFTPTSGGTGASITITGTNFTGATAVSFGGTAATSFTVNSATSITAVVGTGATGNVSVTTPGGTVTLAGFTYTVVTAIDPVPGNSLGIRLYPNPVTNGSFVIDTLKLSDQWEVLEIYDTDGKKKLSSFSIKNKTIATIQIEHLAKGFYTAILRRKNGQSAVIKFLKL